jgi:hypothetical protein
VLQFDWSSHATASPGDWLYELCQQSYTHSHTLPLMSYSPCGLGAKDPASAGSSMCQGGLHPRLAAIVALSKLDVSIRIIPLRGVWLVATTRGSQQWPGKAGGSSDRPRKRPLQKTANRRGDRETIRIVKLVDS